MAASIKPQVNTWLLSPTNVHFTIPKFRTYSLSTF